MSETAKLRELLRFAETAGAGALVNEARRELIDVLLLIDPRKEKTAALARRVREADQRLIRSGVATGRTALLCEQFQVSRQYLHELRRMSGDSVDASVIPSDPCT